MRTGFDLEKIQAALAAASLDAAVLTSLPNFRYVTGIDIRNQATLPMRLQMVVVPVSGDPILLACETREVLDEQKPDWLTDIRNYREFQIGPVELLANTLAELRLDRGQIGFERDWLVARYWEQLRELCPGATFADVGPILNELRAIKATIEIDALRNAYLKTIEAIRESFEATQIGDTEAAIAERIRRGLVTRGAANIGFDVVVIGERSPYAHPVPSDRKLAVGEVLRVDVGGVFELYCSDVGRTASAGRWDPAVKDAFDKLAEIRAEVIPTLSVGTPLGEVYTRILSRYPDYGLPTPPVHTLLIGHSLGIEMHEPPTICPTEETPLAPGMVLNIEPDVRLDGLCLTHECLYLVTEAGLELIAEPEEEVPLVIDAV